MLNRRELLAACAAAPALLAAKHIAAETRARERLGICVYSYGNHSSAGRANNPKAAFKDSLSFLDYCHQLNAGGVQTDLGRGTLDDATKYRTRAESHGMYVEGVVTLPRQESDTERFDAAIRHAKACGAEIARTVLLNGRRYETFATAAAFRQSAEQARKSLKLAEPVARRHGVRLAIENHKDFRVPEMLELLKWLSSEYVGICLDTGNSIALLEDPQAVVEAYAPNTISVHLKDMAVQESSDGFLLSEVPLGDGFLDLLKIVTTIRKASPRAHFNLEMITRDPLSIPCLTDKYWATMEGVSGYDLARMLALVRAKASKRPLPRITGLSLDDRLKVEDDNVRQCIRFARDQLEL